MDNYVVAGLAIAIILSAIVRIIRTDAAWKAVDENYAEAEHLRDLTGILRRAALQDVFGPPTMDGIYHVSHSDVVRERRLMGHFMGNVGFDGASLLIAVLSLVWMPFGIMGQLLHLMLFFATVYQLVGWIATSRLMGDKS